MTDCNQPQSSSSPKGRVAGARIITIIVPTTCEPSREFALRRALASLQSQDIGPPRILVVANGDRVDPQLLGKIADFPGISLIHLEEGNPSIARAAGLTRLTTPYFGFLDDDDEYLPNALRIRFELLEGFPDAAAVVTDGYDVQMGAERIRRVVTERAKADPLRGLLFANWLASCGGLFRSSLMTPDYFDGLPPYFEWTLLAYKMASRQKVILTDIPTYRIHNSPESLSKSARYRDAVIGVLAQILSLELPADVKHGLRVKMGKAYHSLSNYYRQEGNLKRAWRCHLASLRYPEGWQYVLYSRRLFTFRARR